MHILANYCGDGLLQLIILLSDYCSSIIGFKNGLKNGNPQKNAESWHIKQCKGLSTHTREEAKKYLACIEKNRVPFILEDSDDDEALSLVRFIDHFAGVKFNLIICSSIGF